MGSFVTVMANRFQSHFNCDQDLDVDEQGIPAKCYHSAVLYNKDKPYKWFFKIYSLNDSKTSYMHYFYFFRGKDKLRSKDVLAAAYPVMELFNDPQYKKRNHVVFIDNYFNSLKLCEDLLEQGIHTCGTVRPNRIRKMKPPWFTNSGTQ